MATVMIVDDSAIMRRNLTTIFTQAGHTVVAEAVNGGQAHLRYRNFQPDLVTMDITMPGVNGIEGIKLIKKEFPDAKIIVVSALDQRNMVLDALKSGAMHYIIKPISPDKVISVVNKVLGIPEKAENAQAEGLAEVAATSIEEVQESTQDGKPFAIENANGIFRISANPGLTTENVGLLEQAVQGLLFVQPLKVLFSIGETTELADAVLEKIGQFVQKVRAANGEVRVISRNKGLVDKAKQKGIAGLADTIEHK